MNLKENNLEELAMSLNPGGDGPTKPGSGGEVGGSGGNGGEGEGKL